MRAVKGELQHPKKLWQPERPEVNRYRRGACNTVTTSSVMLPAPVMVTK